MTVIIVGHVHGIVPVALRSLVLLLEGINETCGQLFSSHSKLLFALVQVDWLILRIVDQFLV